MRTLRAAGIYFAIVFAAGFIFGTIRTLLLVPHIGATAAVTIEAPLILLVSWFASLAVVERLQIPAEFSRRLAMGAYAFTILMVAELALGVILFGQTPAGHFASYRDLSQQIGLAAQLAFAFIPALQVSFGRR